MNSANMTEAAREARRAYKRAWNRKNRDKVKAAQARYWEKKAQEAAAIRPGEDPEPAQGVASHEAAGNQ